LEKALVKTNGVRFAKSEEKWVRQQKCGTSKSGNQKTWGTLGRRGEKRGSGSGDRAARKPSEMAKKGVLKAEGDNTGESSVNSQG